MFVAMIFAFTSIAVLNTLAMIALRRGRELGLLRLGGATHRHVWSMARWEAALIIAIGPGLGWFRTRRREPGRGARRPPAHPPRGAPRVPHRPAAPRRALRDVPRVGSHALLLALQDDQVLATFRSALLEPLLARDARRHTALLPTIRAFLAADGHYQQTADALHVHVNTLRLRLARIEQLTGRDLSRLEDRVDFYLALGAAGELPVDTVRPGEESS